MNGELFMELDNILGVLGLTLFAIAGIANAIIREKIDLWYGNFNALIEVPFTGILFIVGVILMFIAKFI